MDYLMVQRYTVHNKFSLTLQPHGAQTCQCGGCHTLTMQMYTMAVICIAAALKFGSG